MIEVSHLTKRYGSHTAVSDLSFSVEQGQIYGFLGPNGAGKSTTMNIMTGCLSASAGTVLIGGHDIFEEPDQAKRLIGYLPELPPLYVESTPREYLTFVGRCKKIDRKDLAAQVDHVLEVTGTRDVAGRLIKHLSKGYRQRVGIAQAILGDPEVVILDEPTVGLDPRQIVEIRDLIRELGKNHTVILSSHILSEVQAVCQTILIISKGKLVACDTPERLEARFAGGSALELTALCSRSQARAVLAQVEGIVQTDVTGQEEDSVSLRVESGKREQKELCQAIFFAFAQAGIPLLRLNPVKASLEEIFMELTQGQPPAADVTEPAPQSEEGGAAQ